MIGEDDEQTSGERQVGAIIAAYLEALDRGEAPDRSALLRQHPDCARELESFFADQDQVRGLVRASPESEITPAAVPTLSAAATVGHRLGDYELLEEIGRGGMGVVFRARQVSLGRLVAVKVILAADIASAEELWRFRREAETVARLEHPHVIPIYEAGVHQGHPYFSMPLMEGGSLVGQVARLSADPRAAAEVMAAVAGAVHYAHERGVLHRDLKPANILLDAASRPHVADFGLARRADDTAGTPSGAVIGTPAYMAPEQARGEKNLTVAADVYGLGAILYELLTGRPPFPAATPLDALLQVIENDPDPPRRINPRIDRALETVCLKCLEKEPGRRYPSAQALADDLGRWLRGEPVRASRAGPVRRLAYRARRRPLLMALGLLILLVGAGDLASVWRSAVEADRIEHKNEESQREAVRKKSHYLKVIQDVAERRGNAKELLDSCAPECRGLEWYFLKGMMRGPKRVNGAPHPDKADLRALASRLVRPGRRPAGAKESDPAGPLRVLPNSFEFVILDSTRDGGRTVTCDWQGTVRVRGADGWELALPGVQVWDPDPPRVGGGVARSRKSCVAIAAPVREGGRGRIAIVVLLHRSEHRDSL